MRELLSDFPETDLAIAYGSAVFKQAGYSQDEVCLMFVFPASVAFQAD
jgi:hypothetical protein